MTRIVQLIEHLQKHLRTQADDTREYVAKLALHLLRIDRECWKTTDDDGNDITAPYLIGVVSTHVACAQTQLARLDEELGQSRWMAMQELEIWAKEAREAVNELTLQMSAASVHPINDINVRKKVWQLTGGKCVYCECDLAPWGNETSDSFAVEHVVPRSAGGPDNLANYVPSCKTCNIVKKDSHVIDFIRRKLPGRRVEQQTTLRIIDGDKAAGSAEQ
jgi:hypothetical protein